MAAGARKVRIEEIRIVRGAPVMCHVYWTYVVEDNQGTEERLRDGMVRFQLAATRAAFRTLTGQDIETAVLAAVTAATSVPARDSIS